LTTPAVEVLKANFPDAKLHFLVERPCHEVLNGNPFIDEVLVYERDKPLKWIREVRKRRYDLVVDFLSNPRSAVVTFLSGARLKAGPGYTSSRWAYNVRFPNATAHEYSAFRKIDQLTALGLKTILHPRPRLFLPSWADKYRSNRFREMGLSAGDAVIGFAPASRRATRIWPADHYAALARSITQKTDCKIIVFWGPGEKELAQRIASALPERVMASPETKNLAELGALLKGLKLLVCNFNGTKHIATALDVPTLGIFGMCGPASWTPPDDERQQAIGKDDLPCISCHLTECPRNLECLYQLAPETVFKKLEQMLSNIR